MAKTPKTDTPNETQAPPLFDLSHLADKYRVAAWQMAALMRCMGWDEGKMVSEADFLAATAKLGERRMGGGRLG